MYEEDTTAAAIGTHTSNATTSDLSNATATTASGSNVFRTTFVAAGAALSNLNASVFEVVSCFIGPRYRSRLLITTLSLLGCLVLGWVIPWLVKRVHSSIKFVAEVREKSAKATRTLIFLAYPSLATTIVRTFVCEAARDTNGKQTSWLSDDLLVECSVDKADYNFMRIYAWLMVVVIVIGMPVQFGYRLSKWRFPFNRLYEVQEDGHEGPAKKARFILGNMVVFNTKNWFMPCADMIFKLLLASLVSNDPRALIH